MKLLRQILLSVALLVSLCFFVSAQVKVSDTKLMRLKGQVKSLVSTSKSVSGYAEWVLKDKTKYQTTYLFDRDGNLTEEIRQGSINSKTVFSRIDGYKTFKTIELPTPKNDSPRFTAMASDVEPIEPNEKLTKPDERFEFKYVYETDDRGRVTSERQYKNDGKLFRKRKYEYNNSGEVIKETEEDTIAVMTYSYKYDEKGNVIEVNKTRDIKVNGSDSKERITYTDIKYDSVGNWIERKITRFVKTEGLPQYKIPAETYTLVDISYRTLTYY